MHRRIDLWGPDALKFDPDRFLDARLHKYCILILHQILNPTDYSWPVTPNPFIFLPFNAGTCICDVDNGVVTYYSIQAPEFALANRCVSSQLIRVHNMAAY
jgi:hypothetical protein